MPVKDLFSKKTDLTAAILVLYTEAKHGLSPSYVKSLKHLGGQSRNIAQDASDILKEIGVQIEDDCDDLKDRSHKICHVFAQVFELTSALTMLEDLAKEHLKEIKKIARKAETDSQEALQ